MSTLTTILTLGLILRVTRLLVADSLTFPIRARIVVRYGPNAALSTLVTCSWCMSVWVGAAIGVGAYFAGDTYPWFLVALAATGSLLAGWAARWVDTDVQED